MTELLKTLPYWAHLTEKEQKAVRESAAVRHFETGEILYGPCVNCIGMIHVLTGDVRAYILSDEGREITLFHVEEGDNCILSASCVLAHIDFESYMTASAPSDILIVPVSLFGDLCEENVYVRCFAYELAAKRFSTVMGVIQQMLFSRLDQRLASFLLREYRETGKAEIRMTQEQIAQRINSARETVARVLKRFAEDGLVENRRGVIRLIDPKSLEKQA